MAKKLGRPPKNPYKDNKIYLYLKNPKAKKIHEELKKKGLASEFYAAALLQQYGNIELPRLQEMKLIKKRVGLLNIWKQNRLAESEEQIKSTIQNFDAKIHNLQIRYAELEAKEKEENPCLIKQV